MPITHQAYFTDVFILDGVTIEFTYTKLDGNRWAVRASIAGEAYTATEFYKAIDEKPESLEELFVTHRFAVSHIIMSWGLAVAPKPKGQSND